MAQESTSEKVSVNMNVATLSQMDLLVDNGYFSNRSDFINQAVRQYLDEQRSIIDRIAERNDRMAENSWFLGIYGIAASELEKLKEAGEKIQIAGYGLLTFDRNCTDELILATIKSIHVRGRVSCSQELKRHYGIK